jgi:hypothetical protein
MAQYQRSWFHLLLAEGYLARVERLHGQWDLPCPVDQLASLNELAQMREYAARLLDEAASPRALNSLVRVSVAIKLRVSLLAQATAAAIKPFDENAAHELGHLRRQPMADDRIVTGLQAVRASSCQHFPTPFA